MAPLLAAILASLTVGGSASPGIMTLSGAYVPVRTAAPAPQAFVNTKGGSQRYSWSNVFESEPIFSHGEGNSTAHISKKSYLWRKIEDINLTQNRTVRDFDGEKRGCVQYVLSKMAALENIGVPESALSPAIVRTHGGIVHAVLIVTTEDGDVVLDNLSAYIKPWWAVDYVWVERKLTVNGTGRWAWVQDRGQ
jgi:predicted transglutaminase-like cysteine proteinase